MCVLYYLDDEEDIGCGGGGDLVGEKKEFVDDEEKRQDICCLWISRRSANYYIEEIYIVWSTTLPTEMSFEGKSKEKQKSTKHRKSWQ